MPAKSRSTDNSRSGAPVRGVGAGSHEPATEKSRRTRASLVDAARRVFDRDGFLDARITDISREAGLAHGSFYTHFASKEAIFTEVALQVEQEIYDATRAPEYGRGTDLIADIEAANRGYIEAYRKNRQMMLLITQVALFNEEVRRVQQQAWGTFITRLEHAIARMQGAGIADPALDPHYAAQALGAMVDRFMNVWMLFEANYDLDKAVETLTVFWTRALGLPGTGLPTEGTPATD
ncbi:TetR/AcrR family transcriptional regulator [Nocardia beijingensis]|uniref:TetR/AcrR family transcriptional regulator n=1 Tax=Nocardia beijingensis TaxID=95162 RepID=UPI0033DAC80E